MRDLRIEAPEVQADRAAMQRCDVRDSGAWLIEGVQKIVAVWSAKEAESGVSNWQIIADNLSKAGWSWGWVSAVDAQRRRIFIANAHRDEKSLETLCTD